MSVDPDVGVLLRRLASAAIMKALGRYGKLLEDGTRKAAGTTGNIWNHRTYFFPYDSGPSLPRFLVVHAR
jgi:hypothetical protein